jgi:hypothetical protein
MGTTHEVKRFYQVPYLRLTSGILDDGLPFRKDRAMRRFSVAPTEGKSR